MRRMMIIFALESAVAFSAAWSTAGAAEPQSSETPTAAAEKPDLKRIIGVWKGTRFYVNGQLQNLMPDDSIVVEFTADGFKANVAVDGGTQEIDGTYFLDEKQTPKVLDAALRTSAEGQDVAAIYRLEENSLTVCFRSDGGPRPADIDKPGEMTIKVVFKREPR
jgi:uncharacterized protein (TIGR03067 family)